MSHRKLWLEPLNQLELVKTTETATEWLMTGNDPYFLIRGLNRLRAGIYELTIETSQDSSGLVQPTIYFDCGRGYNAEDVIPLAFEDIKRGPRKFARAYFRLRSKTYGLRFDPSVAAGELAIGTIAIRRVSKTWWRAKEFAAFHADGIRGLAGLKRCARSATRIFARSGLSGLHKAFKEAAEMKQKGIFQELPFGKFVKECDADAQKFRSAEGWKDSNLAASERALTIVIPVHHVRASWFEELLQSLAAQTSKAFHLVLVFDGIQPELVAIAKRFKSAIPNLELVQLPEQSGVSNACNEGVKRAVTDYVVIVDHDDLLPSYLVEFFHRAVNHAPDADIIFFDEALIDENAENEIIVSSRGSFDLRHYLSHPYIVHPIFFSKDLLLRAGGFDSSLTVSQDVDLFLRCVALAKVIVHVPAMGYFWRVHKKSLGSRTTDKVAANNRLAITKFVQSFFGWPTFKVADGPNFNTYDVTPPLPEQARVAIIIPTKNRHELLSACLDSIFERKGDNNIPFDVFVIDHQSDDEEAIRFLAEEKARKRSTILPYAGRWNFSKINNFAVGKIEALGGYTHLCFMNNDIVLQTPNWLDLLISRFSYPDVGIVGACLLYPDGKVQHGGVVVGLCGAAEHAFKTFPADLPSYLCSLSATRDYGAVTAALMVMPRSLFSKLNGFDESLSVGFNDTDLCLRAGKLGYKSCYVGAVTALHFESASRGHTPHPQDTALFIKRHADIIGRGDDYYGRFMDWYFPLPRFTFTYAKPFRFQVSRRNPARASFEVATEDGRPQKSASGS